MSRPIKKQETKRYMKRTATAFLAVAVLVAGCGQNKDAGDQAAQAPSMEAATPMVTVATAELQTVPQESVYSSTVQANVVNNIAPQTTGRIKKINVEIGNFVSKGDVLAEMDRAQLDQAELKLHNDKEELDRVKQLLAEGGISQSDYDALELAFKVSKSSYDNILENTILRSPVSGVITARNYDVGDLYSMGTPIYTVQQITPVKLLVGISETDYTRVKRGDKVSITADALPGKTYTGTVNRIYPTMDSATHTFNAEVLVANGSRDLRPGMYARVLVNFGAMEGIVVPDEAPVKQQGSGQRLIYVVERDSTVATRLVTLGRHFENKYVVTEGLEAGETVVVSGQAALKSGIKVEVNQ